MKKIITGSIALLLIVTLFAQPERHHDGLPRPPSAAERWKRDSIRMQLYVTLNPSQIDGVKNALVTSYNSMDALMGQNKTAPPSKEEDDKIHQQIESIRTNLHSALKSILNSGQYDRFETFEREILPPPPPHPMQGQRQPPTE